MREDLSWKNYVLHLRHRLLLSGQDLAARFAGKTVSVVGNSRALVNGEAGSAIDSSDEVVRFNACPMAGTASHGHRTDWIALSYRLPKSRFVELGRPGILWMTPRRSLMPAWLLSERRLYVHPIGAPQAADAAVGARPSTGLMAVLLLASLDVSTVRLFGFDFYKSLSLSGNQTMENTPHNYASEEAIVGRLMARDSRIQLC